MAWVRIGPRTKFKLAYLLLWLKLCINSILGHSRLLFVLRLYQWTQPLECLEWQIYICDMKSKKCLFL